MNKYRNILQYNFNNRGNGYFGYDDGDYDTRVNWDIVGLYYRYCYGHKLSYIIR